MPRYATETSVPVEKTRAEIETVLSRYGADAFGYAIREGVATIEFACNGRHVRFTLPLPSRNGPEFQKTPAKGRQRSAQDAGRAWEQACRQRWRALHLAIKAKLEAVECGIAEFEDEFLAYVVDPATRQTVGNLIRGDLAQRYIESSPEPLGLPGPTITK